MPSTRAACNECHKEKEVNSKGFCVDCSITNLTIDAVRDFQACELYYKYKYIDKRSTPHVSRDIMARKFENTLKRVASFFFYKKQAGSVPSYNAILNRWEKLWFPKNMTAYDLAVEQHEAAHGNIASYSNIAAASLEHFHDEFADDPSDPLLIDEEYTIPIRPDLRIKGSIDIVLRNKSQYRVIKWLSKKPRSIDPIMMDVAAMRLAFEYRNDDSKNVSYECYDLSSARNPYFKIEQPTKADVNALVYWAQEAVDTNLYVPRRGFTTYCKGCPFDSPCAEFDEWPEVLK